ncbi:MAG: site-2 protease family protein [Oscillospiraceae bacterium]|nr:site-2 protease family protein [Oscillospiraceae bacterium]
MLLSLLRNGFSISTLIGVFSSIFVVFCTMPVHEYAHAFVATKLGDQTPRLSGRLTLNPLAHIDIMGALMILLFRFGYAKPVPVNPRNFKDPKKGMALTAAAGPISNLIMSVFFILLANIACVIYSKTGGFIVAEVSLLFFFYAASINVYLAVFNLLPIPPLDGSRILGLILPSKIYYKVMQYERYIVLAVFALILFGVLSGPLSFVSNKLFYGIAWLVSLPFGEYGDVILSFISA